MRSFVFVPRGWWRSHPGLAIIMVACFFFLSARRGQRAGASLQHTHTHTHTMIRVTRSFKDLALAGTRLHKTFCRPVSVGVHLTHHNAPLVLSWRETKEGGVFTIDLNAYSIGPLFALQHCSVDAYPHKHHHVEGNHVLLNQRVFNAQPLAQQHALRLPLLLLEPLCELVHQPLGQRHDHHQR